MVFEIAQELGVGDGIQCRSTLSDPMQIANLLSFSGCESGDWHGGSDNMVSSVCFSRAPLRQCVCGTKLVGYYEFRSMYKQIRASKMMFSSDMLVNLPVELCKYNLVFKNEADREQVFIGNQGSLYLNCC